MRQKTYQKSPLKTLSLLLFLFFTGFAAFPQAQPDIIALIDQAVDYEISSKFDEAIETYRKILEIDAANAFAGIHLAKLLSWQNKFDEAIGILNEVIAVDPDQLEALFRKAQILSWQGKYDESIQTYESYLSYKNNDPLGLMGIARVFFWSGRHREAIEHLRLAMEAGAEETEARIELGKVYLAADDKERARDEFNRVLEIDPGNPDATRFLEGIPTLRKYELSPLGLTLSIYPDESIGVKLSSFFTYHHKELWDLTFRIEDETVSGVHDQTLAAAYVYRGIRELYLLGSLSFAPAADFTPGYRGEIAANYVFKKGLGLGLALSADVFTEAPLSSIRNDTRYAVKPEIGKYFGDIGSVFFRYNQYFYASGFNTRTVTLNLTVQYYKRNDVYGGITYGGDIETRTPGRKVFEFNLGISHNITEKLGFALGYTRTETQFGKTNQFNLQSIIQW